MGRSPLAQEQLEQGMGRGLLAKKHRVGGGHQVEEQLNQEMGRSLLAKKHGV